jgi:hypothetical protein
MLKGWLLSLLNRMLHPFGLIAMKIEDREEVYRLLDDLKASMYSVESLLPQPEQEKIRLLLNEAQAYMDLE